LQYFDITTLRLFAFIGPILIISISLLTIFKQISIIKKVKLLLGIYFLSILTGIMSDLLLNFEQSLTAIIAGVLSPVIYCFIVYKFAKKFINASKGSVKEEIIEYYSHFKSILKCIFLPVISASLGFLSFIFGYVQCSWGCSSSEKNVAYILFFITLILLLTSIYLLTRNILKLYRQKSK